MGTNDAQLNRQQIENILYFMDRFDSVLFTDNLEPVMRKYITLWGIPIVLSYNIMQCHCMIWIENQQNIGGDFILYSEFALPHEDFENLARRLLTERIQGEG